MGKIASAIVAVTLLTSPLLLPVPASAENGQIAAGVVGGLIGGALLAALWQHGQLRLRRRFIMRLSRSTSKSLPVVWFGSATGMDMAGNFVESRFAIDRRTVSGGRAVN